VIDEDNGGYKYRPKILSSSSVEQELDVQRQEHPDSSTDASKVNVCGVCGKRQVQGVPKVAFVFVIYSKFLRAQKNIRDRLKRMGEIIG
jgi:hypothetical protein